MTPIPPSIIGTASPIVAIPRKMFGVLIAEFMDVEPTPWVLDRNSGVDQRERIAAVLAREGLSYSRGGYIHGAALSGPSRSLAERINSDGIQAVEIEYDRAYKSIESDPGAAVTAACAILESVCKCYQLVILYIVGLEIRLPRQTRRTRRARPADRRPLPPSGPPRGSLPSVVAP
jgi:hypothetical protein